MWNSPTESRSARRHSNRLVLAAALVAAISTVSTVSAIQAQTALPSRPELSKVLRRAVRDQDVPGLVARLAEGKSFVSASAGVRQRGTSVRFLSTDPVHIGSCLKAMTATAAARLIERGALRWDSTVAEIFPELQGAIDPANASIRLDELLAHRSGLTDDIPQDLYDRAIAFQGTGDEARRIFLPEYLALPPGAEKGTFNYSNLGYALAGAMLERVTGKPFRTLIRDEVFGPLGLRSAQFGAPGSNQPGVIDAPRGHDADGHPLLPREQSDPPILEPAGTFSMNLEDWAKFAQAQFGRPVGGRFLLSKASLAKIHRPVGGPIDDTGSFYALGWVWIDAPGGIRLLAHDGSNEAWLSRILINLKNERVLLVSSNEGSLRAEAALDQTTFDPSIILWLLGR